MSTHWTPHAYQKKALAWLISRGAAGLFLDPGLGKTAIALAAFSVLRAKRMARKLLVVAPLRPVYEVWPAEIKKWADFEGLTYSIVHGQHKEKALQAKADVYLINYDGLAWLGGQGGKGLRPQFDMLVLDESPNVKDPSTRRFQALKAMLGTFDRRYLLTGSPSTNGLMDLFGQIYCLDLGESLGRYITHYRSEYFTNGYPTIHNYRPQPDAEERIQKKLSPLCLRMEAGDYLELPDLVGALDGASPPLITNITLPPAVRKTYDTMEQELVASMESGTVLAANAAVAAGKCRQIANGGLYADPDWHDALPEPGAERSYHHLHDLKTDAVEEIVGELGDTPAMVAYEFKHDLARLQDRFHGAPVIGGGVTTKNFKKAVEAWNAGLLPVLLVQPQSVSHGLNLQGTKGAVIWHSNTHNLAHYEQLIRRLWRQGQKHKVFVHHIVARGTVDEIMIRSIQRKDVSQRYFLEQLKDKRKKAKKPASRVA